MMMMMLMIIIINLLYGKEKWLNYKMQTPKYSYMSKACGVASSNITYAAVLRLLTAVDAYLLRKKKHSFTGICTNLNR